MEAKRKWQIFQALTEKNHQLIVIYLQKICFRNERKIKVFSDEVKVREFVTSRCTLNLWLKEVNRNEIITEENL